MRQTNVSPGAVLLPDLPPGLTTCYDAALVLTDHEPRDEFLGIGGQYPATRSDLEIWIKRTVQADPTNTTWHFYCDLCARLRDGRIRPNRAAYLDDGTLDPFLTLISYADARAVFNERASPQQLEVAAGVPPTVRMRNKRGPQPIKRNAIAQRMVSDYCGSPDALEGEKLDYLEHTYSGASDTVNKARDQALAELRKNSGKTPDTGK